MELTTARCAIRVFSPEDAPQLHQTLSDAEVMVYIEPPFTPEQTKAFIAEAGLCDPPRVYALTLKETGSMIGHVIFHRYEEDSYEIGWILNRSVWGMGIASEVTAALAEHARNLGVASCVIECDPRQAASRRIAEKYGFLLDGEDDGCEVYRLSFRDV